MSTSDPQHIAHSLRDPLPSEFIRGSSFSFFAYRNYPVFSWPWLWRRTLLFSVMAIVFSTFGALPMAAILRESGDLLTFWLRSVLGWIAVFAPGPCLAALIRYRPLPEILKNIALVAAIVVAMFVCYLEQRSFDAYMLSREKLQPLAQLFGVTTQNAQPTGRTVQPLSTEHRLIKISYQVSVGSICFALGGGVALFGYFRQQRRWREHVRNQELRELRMQRDESDRRLTVLQAQVEPHFLFNTLASVRSLIKSEPQRAEATIDALVDHLRATLPKLRGQGLASISTLAQQLEICRSYLEVMRVRMGGRLSFSIELPPSLSDATFPPLMLISLVENAIKHGVEPKPGPCSIRIAAQLRSHEGEQQIEVGVLDDGAGLRPGLSDGVGLSNLRAQLRTRYGKRASLRLEQRDSGGVAARLYVPMAVAVTHAA